MLPMNSLLISVGPHTQNSKHFVIRQRLLRREINKFICVKIGESRQFPQKTIFAVNNVNLLTFQCQCQSKFHEFTIFDIKFTIHTEKAVCNFNLLQISIEKQCQSFFLNIFLNIEKNHCLTRPT